MRYNKKIIKLNETLKAVLASAKKKHFEEGFLWGKTEK